MFSKIVLFFLFVRLSISQNVNNNTLNSQDSNLISVIVIYRHGARTPIKPYPNDPYKDEKYWPVGFGQLTNRGKEQEYELGQWLRKRYSTFLPIQYSEKDIYVRSTDVDRTLMSAEVNLAGMYPPDKKETWNANINWQPIPVHTLPEKEDAVLAMKKSCPKYDKFVKDLSHDPTIADINKRNHDLYSYLSRNTGKHVNSMTELEYVYSTLKIESDNNFTLPNWTDKVFPNKLKPLAEFAFALPCYTKEMAKLKVGPLFHEIREHIENKTNVTIGAGHPKFFIYSAHDTTIANVLKGLDLFEAHAPPFSATILFELYESNDKRQHYLNIFYKNSSNGVAKMMKLNGCDYNCPIVDFFKITDPITIDLNDWYNNCQTFNFIEAIMVLTVVVIGIISLTCLILTLFAKWNRKEKKTYLRLPDDENV